MVAIYTVASMLQIPPWVLVGIAEMTKQHRDFTRWLIRDGEILTVFDRHLHGLPYLSDMTTYTIIKEDYRQIYDRVRALGPALQENWGAGIMETHTAWVHAELDPAEREIQGGVLSYLERFEYDPQVKRWLGGIIRQEFDRIDVNPYQYVPRRNSVEGPRRGPPIFHPSGKVFF